MVFLAELDGYTYLRDVVKFTEGVEVKSIRQSKNLDLANLGD